MTFFEALRSSITGTTSFFQKKVPGRWSFFIAFLFTFGVIQLLTVVAFFFCYTRISSEFGVGFMDDLIFNISDGFLLYFMQFVTLYQVIFLVTMLHKAKGAKITSLSFSALFQRISLKSLIVYLVSLIVTLSIVMWLVNTQSDGYYGFQFEQPMRIPTVIIDDWYIVLFKYFVIVLLEILPAIVLGYYIVSLKEGSWKMSFLLKYWKPVLALICIILALRGVLEFVTNAFAKIFVGTLVQTMQNEEVILLFSILVTLVVSLFYYAVVGSLSYFSIVDAESKVENMDVEDTSSQLLDQI